MGADGIARSEVLPDAEIDIDEAIENSQAVNSLYRGTKYPLLVDITKIKSITKEARAQFSVKNRDTHITAFALLGKSEIGCMVANLFFRLHKPGVPGRMFTEEEDAIEWLNKYKVT